MKAEKIGTVRKIFLLPLGTLGGFYYMVLKIVLFNQFFKLQNHSALRIIFFLNTGTFIFPYFRKIRIAKKFKTHIST